MFRELLVLLYLLHIKFWFTIFKLLPIKNKTTFVSSFGDNVYYTWQKVIELTDHKTIILHTDGKKGDINKSKRTTAYNFHLLHNPISFISGIYHLATSKVIFVDNYFGFLSATDFREGVTCVQLWHANGAIKRFGLKDPSIRFRSKRAYNRFKNVYKSFHRTVVGSEEMEYIFNQAFDVKYDTFLRTGIPRTDIFFDHQLQMTTNQKLKKQFSIPENKKIILYAPTFRDSQLKQHSIKLNLKKLYSELKDDHLLMLRLHPAILKKYNNNYPDFIIDVSDYPEINHLLFVSDYLVTDYSSIPFEYTLLEKPMIFYPYDLNEYSETRGFWETYEELVPGPIATNTDELIHIIKYHNFNFESIKRFTEKWNKFNQGESSTKLVERLYK